MGSEPSEPAHPDTKNAMVLIWFFICPTAVSYGSVAAEKNTASFISHQAATCLVLWRLQTLVVDNKNTTKNACPATGQ